MTSFDWSGANINHSFFPLSGGHAIDATNAIQQAFMEKSLQNVFPATRQIIMQRMIPIMHPCNSRRIAPYVIL